MRETIKNLIAYLLLILLTLGCIRIYDYVTRDPAPVDREENHEIIELNKRIDSILDSANSDKKRSEKAMYNVYLSLDSIKDYRKTATNERKKLKATPDSLLIHYRDSIKKANGL